MQQYSDDFFEHIQGGSLRSAREIVPLVLKLIQSTRVIDVGCGVGTWLLVFKECGVEEILGVDGDHVNKEKLLIPSRSFLSRDLREPLRLNSQFDLVVSLEVAEHLPGECAGTLVDSLTKLGPAVLFSAAPPFQGGVNHINEQWPDYWSNLFKKRGFEVVDCIRKRIWQNDNVEWWYAQNILLFANCDYLDDHPALKLEVAKTNHSQMSIVHPRNYAEKCAWIGELESASKNKSLGQLISELAPVGKKAVAKRMKRILGRNLV